MLGLKAFRHGTQTHGSLKAKIEILNITQLNPKLWFSTPLGGSAEPVQGALDSTCASSTSLMWKCKGKGKGVLRQAEVAQGVPVG